MNKILNNLTNDFNNIIETRNNIYDILINIKRKIEILNTIYKELLLENNNNDNVTWFDSFNFQNKLFLTEYNHFLNIFNKIQNCIYSEYYKLYNKLYNYSINYNITNLIKNVSKYPKYYDINNNNIYDIEIIIDIQQNCIIAIKKLLNIYTYKKKELLIKQKKSKLGLNIDNTIISEKFNNNIINNNIDLFISYLNTFNVHHYKYYTRLMLKIKLILGIVNQDIKIKQFENGNNKDLKNVFSNFSKKFDSSTDIRSSSPSLSCSSSIEENEVVEIKNYMDLNINPKSNISDEFENILNTNKMVKSNIKNFSLKKMALKQMLSKRKKSVKNVSFEILLKKKKDKNELISEEKNDDKKYDKNDDKNDNI